MQLAQQLRPLRLPAAETEEFRGREPQTALRGEHPGVKLHKIMKTVTFFVFSTQSCGFNLENLI